MLRLSWCRKFWHLAKKSNKAFANLCKRTENQLTFKLGLSTGALNRHEYCNPNRMTTLGLSLKHFFLWWCTCILCACKRKCILQHKKAEILQPIFFSSSHQSRFYFLLDSAAFKFSSSRFDAKQSRKERVLSQEKNTNWNSPKKLLIS